MWFSRAICSAFLLFLFSLDDAASYSMLYKKTYASAAVNHREAGIVLHQVFNATQQPEQHTGGTGSCANLTWFNVSTSSTPIPFSVHFVDNALKPTGFVDVLEMERQLHNQFKDMTSYDALMATRPVFNTASLDAVVGRLQQHSIPFLFAHRNGMWSVLVELGATAQIVEVTSSTKPAQLEPAGCRYSLPKFVNDANILGDEPLSLEPSAMSFATARPREDAMFFKDVLGAVPLDMGEPCEGEQVEAVLLNYTSPPQKVYFVQDNRTGSDGWTASTMETYLRNLRTRVSPGLWDAFMDTHTGLTVDDLDWFLAKVWQHKVPYLLLHIDAQWANGTCPSGNCNLEPHDLVIATPGGHLLQVQQRQPAKLLRDSDYGFIDLCTAKQVLKGRWPRWENISTSVAHENLVV